jgi:uncharacterized membrane protein
MADDIQGPVEPPNHPSHRGRQITRYFLAGLVVAGPIALTFFLAWWVIELVDRWVKPLIPARFNPDNYLPFAVPGIGLILALAAIVLIGFFATNLLGRSLVRLGESILAHVPVLSTLYSALKQIFETVVNQGSNNFRQAALVEFPRKGLWAIVFVSTTTKGELAEKAEGEDIISCFMPTTPNPTSGFLIFVPRKDVRMLDMSIEDAAKVIISAGLVMPEYRKRTAELAEAALKKDAGMEPTRPE